MTLFAIFQHQTELDAMPRVVAEKFSWLAFLLPPVFALVHGLWLELLAFVLAVVALGVAAPFVGGAIVWVYLLFALWLGLEAPTLLRANLSRRHFRHRALRVAPSADLALLGMLERRP